MASPPTAVLFSPGSWISRVLTAVVAVAIAHLATRLAGRMLEHDESLLLITAVMISALYGGVLAGLAASGLAALVSAFYYLPPERSLHLDGEDLLRLLVFVSIALLVSWLSGALRRSEEALRSAHGELEGRVTERTAELTRANRDLQAEVTERTRAEAQILAYQLRLQSLAAELSITEERSRRDVATALHDAIGHPLAVALMKIRAVMGSNQLDGTGKPLGHACELIEQTIRHTRTLTLQLSPPVLYELGLQPAIEWLAEQMEVDHSIRIEVRGGGGGFDFPEETRSLLFSAARELLMNVVKHASGATRAIISLECDDKEARITVEDDGPGFDPSPHHDPGASGYGLFNLRERFAHIGGRVEIDAASGRGSRIRLVAPAACAPTAQPLEPIP